MKIKSFSQSTFFVLMFTTALLLQFNCASIIHGSKQEISVDSEPSGAKVTAKLRGFNLGTTPALITLKRKESPMILRFEKEGYEPVEVTMTRGVDGWIFGNIIFGGIIGLIVDFSNGAAYKLSPEQIKIELKKLKTSIEDLPKDGIVIAIDSESSKK